MPAKGKKWKRRKAEKEKDGHVSFDSRVQFEMGHDDDSSEDVQMQDGEVSPRTLKRIQLTAKLKRSPSRAQLDQMERATYVLWRHPVRCLHYFILELCALAAEFSLRSVYIPSIHVS